ncbi:MAG TPA: hypothetical protein VMS76_08725, partial [Planctomycetota bacterium]|nr:hypothetical protein [Planctomycetota bacterium]
MDLANFRLIRNPRAEPSAPAELVGLQGAQTDALAEQIGRRAPERRVARRSDSARPRRAEFSDEVRSAAASWQAGALDPLAFAAAGAEASSPLERLLAALGEADRWLQAALDDPAPPEYREFRAALLAPPAEAALFDEAAALLSDWIATELVAERRFERLARLTRLRSVADALDARLVPDAALHADAERHLVRDFLQRRTHYISPLLTGTAPGEEVHLVRDAKVSDLFVVRSEWSCYQAGEIASIRNVLAGESLEQELRLTREEETITREEREELEAREQTEEDRTQTELAREVERAATRQLSVEGSVDVSGQYGLTRYAASARAAASAALSEATRQASKIARDLVSRA